MFVSWLLEEGLLQSSHCDWDDYIPVVLLPYRPYQLGDCIAKFQPRKLEHQLGECRAQCSPGGFRQFGSWSCA